MKFTFKIQKYQTEAVVNFGLIIIIAAILVFIVMASQLSSLW